MVGFPRGLPGSPAVSPVEGASRRGADCATTPFQPMVGSHAKGWIQKHDTVKISRVQWMATGQNGAFGKNVLEAVDMATSPGPERAATHWLSMEGGHAKGLRWRSSCATSDLAQFMGYGVLGNPGVHAAKAVGKVPRQEQDFATTHHHPLEDPTAAGQRHRCRFAMKDSVQLMASGQRGQAGVPVLCPVEEGSGREPGTVPTQPPSMEEADVKGVMSRVIFATVTLVQPTVTGVLGVVGERAAGHAMEGRCGDTARVTTPVPPMEEELAGVQTPRSRVATLTCVLWMEVGETGIVGAIALPLVEEVRRPGSGCVTVQCPPKVAVPVQEMPLRYPDAIHKHVQVGPSEPGEVLLEILMMLSLELLSLMPQ